MTDPVPRDSFYVQWHILDRCNLRCRHCYQDDFSRGREMDWSRLKYAADNLLQTMQTWGTRLDAALTGGEPFLKPELLTLLQYLDNSPQVGNLSIISNGTVFPEYARQLPRLSKISEIRVSLDGISPETNDAIRGKGVLDKVKVNIARWRDLGLPVTVMFTVMKGNRSEIPRLIEFGKSLDLAAIIIERFFPLGRGEEIQTDALNGNEFLQVWQDILAQVEITADPADLISYRAIRLDFDRPDEVDVLGSGCVVAKDGLAILPDATLLPCRRFTLPIGNLMEQSLDEIWRKSPVLEALRDKTRLKGKCGRCEIDDCFGCRAMCYCLEKDYLAGDPHCWIFSD